MMTMQNFCNIFFTFYFIAPMVCSNTENIKIWGPGLQSQITMPARYFFVELNDSDSDLKVLIEGKKEINPCRIRTELLNRKDGVYIFRYKLYESCDILQINIMYKNLHIGESPYILKNVYADECICPIDMNSWLNTWECGVIPSRIIKDLKEFPNINWDHLRDEVITNLNNPGSVSLCHYLIKSNIIYRKCYGKYTGFKMFMDSMLLSLTRKVTLPDVEFFVNLGDWPLSSEILKVPIFSWCSSSESYDIVMPTYDISESTLENMGRVTLDMLSVQGNVNKIWKERIPKGFWRGRDSNKERLKLIDISRENPHLYNVSLTNFFFFRDLKEKYGPKADYVSFFSFFDYKYQIDIDGTVAAYRTPYLFGGGSLIFKQQSKYYEHFYDGLVPNVHYIPIKRDLSDLTEKLEWAKENDDSAHTIATEGQKFAVNNLLPKNIFCYYVHLINEFSKIVKSPVTVLKDMEPVNQSGSNCKCNLYTKDEL